MDPKHHFSNEGRKRAAEHRPPRWVGPHLVGCERAAIDPPRTSWSRRLLPLRPDHPHTRASLLRRLHLFHIALGSWLSQHRRRCRGGCGARARGREAERTGRDAGGGGRGTQRWRCRCGGAWRWCWGCGDHSSGRVTLADAGKRGPPVQISGSGCPLLVVGPISLRADAEHH